MVALRSEGAVRAIPLAIALLLCSSGGAPLHAQTFAGDVTDETGNPLSDVTIGLFDADRELVATASSDVDGFFSVTAPAAGRYTVHLTRFGYRSLTGGPYDLVTDITLEARVVMHRAPARLDPVEVEVEGRIPRLVMSGFYQRQAEGRGYFLDREEILRRGGMSVAQALDRIPRVWVGRSSNLLGPGAVRNQTLVFGRGTLDCVPALWVDGSLMRDGGSLAPPLRLDDYVSVDDVAGVEFYGGPASVPIQFSHSGACAVVLVWTRGGERGGGGRP